jgi:hypothetical protein
LHNRFSDTPVLLGAVAELEDQRDQSFRQGHDLVHALPPGDCCTLTISVYASTHTSHHWNLLCLMTLLERGNKIGHLALYLWGQRIQSVQEKLPF